MAFWMFAVLATRARAKVGMASLVAPTTFEESSSDDARMTAPAQMESSNYPTCAASGRMCYDTITMKSLKCCDPDHTCQSWGMVDGGLGGWTCEESTKTAPVASKITAHKTCAESGQMCYDMITMESIKCCDPDHTCDSWGMFDGGLGGWTCVSKETEPAKKKKKRKKIPTPETCASAGQTCYDIISWSAYECCDPGYTCQLQGMVDGGIGVWACEESTQKAE